MAARWLVPALLMTLPAAGRAADDAGPRLQLSGTLSSDVRFDVERYRGIGNQGYAFSVNRNDLTLHADLMPSERVVAVIDARLRYYGLNRAVALSDTSDRDKIDPFSVQLDQAYVAVRGVPVASMDLKIGRMIQQWGAADMFNPTDNLNARDFYDPMDYTRKVPNQMLELDWYPAEWFSLQGVVVPVFKPSELPESTAMAYLVETDARGCFVAAPAAPLERAGSLELANKFGSVDPCSLHFGTPQVNTIMPKNELRDAQAGVRAKIKAGDLELGLSYYYGRFSFPVALDAQAAATVTSNGTDVTYLAEVYYPRMQVAGLDFSYSAPWLLDIGFVGELAIIFPEQVDFGLRAFVNGSKAVELRSRNVSDKPFIKATLGGDYTFTKWLYVNAMFVHGFFDEFNDAYGVHNYAVASADVKTLDDSVVWRASAVVSVDDYSAVLNPQVTWVVVPGVEVLGGAFVYVGSTHPSDPNDYAARKKFGQKAAGRSIAFVKGRLTW